MTEVRLLRTSLIGVCRFSWMIQSPRKKALITVTVDRPLQDQLGMVAAGGTVCRVTPLHPAPQDGGISNKVFGLTAQLDLCNGTAMQRVNMTTTIELQQDEEC